MTFYIVPIVEGKTEVSCIERLLHRLWNELLGAPLRLQVLQPSRGNRDALIDPALPELAKKIEEAHAKLSRRLHFDPGSQGLLLLLLDAEHDCPARLAPKLLGNANGVRGDVDIVCVLAKQMFENWIVAGVSTLSGVNDLPFDLLAPERVEDCNGTAWLDSRLRSNCKGRAYKKTADASLFVDRMALLDCQSNAPSFDKLFRELQKRIVLRRAQLQSTAQIQCGKVRQ